jgi:peptide/nickel transport system substrate-binding protein
MKWEEGGLRMEGNADTSADAGKGKSKMKIIAIVVVAVLIVAALGAALLMSGGGDDEEKILVVATISGNPESLDPAVDYETAGGEIIQNVYETLMFYDGASADVLKPMLCTAVPTVANGGVSADGLTYTYHLREGVVFHDGTEMTADDVVYSYARFLRLNDPHGPAWMVAELLIPDYYAYVDENGTIDPDGEFPLYPAGTYNTDGTLKEDTGVSWEAIRGAIWAVDDYTVQMNLTTTFSGWNYVITFGVASIVSKDYVEANGGMNKTGYEFMFDHMCGTGAFSLGEFAPDTHFLLLRNDDYWQTPAKLDKVLIKQIPDANTRLLMIQSGEADIAAIPRTLRSSVINDTNIEVTEGLGTFNVDFIGMNQDINFNSSITSTTDVPADFFANKNVRLAFAHAMNVSKLIETQYNGAGIQPNGAIPKGMFGYDPDVPTYAFDLALVASYLENATYTDPDTNETWNWLEHGFNLEIYYNDGNTVRQTACAMFEDGLESVSDNINIDVIGLEWSQFLFNRKKGSLPVMFLGWAPDYADPNNYMQPFFHSAGTYGMMVGYGNSTVDALIEDAAIETDATLRAEKYSNLSFLMYQECVHIWTVQATNFHVERVTVDGYAFNPMYSGFYYYPMDKE